MMTELGPYDKAADGAGEIGHCRSISTMLLDIVQR